MPSLPIPMISALALGFLFAALVLKRDRHWLLAVLVGACALQGVVISLRQHYGISIFMAVQPVTAMLIPPLAWIAFQVTAVRSLRGAHEVLHLGGPLLTLLCAWRLPSALDVMIPLVFLGYSTCAASVTTARRGCCSACNFDPQYQATSIAYRADRRATHAPNNTPVSFRHHIVTGFDLIPDGTCHAKHRHLPLFSNRIPKLGASVKLPIRE